MFRHGLFHPGDYIRYTGDQSIAEGILREEALARIEQFETFNEVERIYLFVLNKRQNIWCDYDKIRPIETDETHLAKAGFVTELNGNAKRYVKGNITISSAYVLIADIGYHFLSGLCVADFTVPHVISVQKYLESGEFNILDFYNDFPSVHNINEFFDLLDEREIAYNKEEILIG